MLHKWKGDVMGEKARLSVALDMLIEYLLQEGTYGGSLNADQRCASLQYGACDLSGCMPQPVSSIDHGTVDGEN